ncbi:MAG: hypothetical protein SGI83_05660 [Bacteroidota bacterium]|nr:hypothetical protein [Bacteroidota bacterium]
MNKRNRSLLLLLLLLLAAGAVWYFYPNKKQQKQDNFTQQGQLEITAGDIVIEVWDHDAEDGDSIQVFFNGKMLADSLAILNTHVAYPLGKLSPGEYWIGVKAINEGSTSPASAYIRLINKSDPALYPVNAENLVEFSMEAWVDSAASWKLIVK